MRRAAKLCGLGRTIPYSRRFAECNCRGLGALLFIVWGFFESLDEGYGNVMLDFGMLITGKCFN